MVVGGGGMVGTSGNCEEETMERMKNEDDTDEDEKAGLTPTVIFKERWRQKEDRLKRASRLAQTATSGGWRLMPIIGESTSLTQCPLPPSILSLCIRHCDPSRVHDYVESEASTLYP